MVTIIGAHLYAEMGSNGKRDKTYYCSASEDNTD